MEKDLIIVEYGKTKNHYTILVDKALMKNPETGEWQECVIYQGYKILNKNGEYIEDMNKLTFVREYNDFWNKFTLCLDL